MFSKEDKDATHFKQLRNQTVSTPFTEQSEQTSSTRTSQKLATRPLSKRQSLKQQRQTSSHTSQHKLVNPQHKQEQRSTTSQNVKKIKLPQRINDKNSAEENFIFRERREPATKSLLVPHEQSNKQTTKEESTIQQTITDTYNLSQKAPHKRVTFDLSYNEIKILKAQRKSSLLTVNDILDIQTRLSRENASIPCNPMKETQLKNSQSFR